MATLLGLPSFVISCFYFAPRVRILPPTIPLGGSPLADPFVIENDSALAIRSVQFACGVNEVLLPGGGGVEGMNVMDDDTVRPPIPVIEPGQQDTAHCALAPFMAPEIDKADIEIGVVFVYPRLWSWFVKTHTYQRFVLVKDAGGSRWWKPAARSE